MKVNDQPYLILGGELHNSSASSVAYMDRVWQNLGPTAINTLLVNVGWQQFEPVEGQFDYTVIDSLIENARVHDKRLVILWFGSWKNGASSYPPTWVVQDQRRFPRVRTEQGGQREILSLFGAERTLAAETRAYSALMTRIRNRDADGRVIMMQINNEVGILGQGYDHSKAAVAYLRQPVPPALLRYMHDNAAKLRPELLEAWTRAGRASSGSWLTVFGDTPAAREFALAWNYATYSNSLSVAGKKIHALPTFVNAWLVQDDTQRAGDYPGGGPVSRVMDIYKAGAPSLDLLAPDIYLPDFRSIVADYSRADNPLFIPESTHEVGRAFYALGQHNALGYSPFGIDNMAKLPPLEAGYQVLDQIAPLILEARLKGWKTIGILRQGKDEYDHSVELDDMTIKIRYQHGEGGDYAILIRDREDHLYIAGQNMFVSFSSKIKGKAARIATVYEGVFVEGQWQPGRLLNGDETFHNENVRVESRKSGDVTETQAAGVLAPQPTAETVLKQPSARLTKTAYEIPQIYSVDLYWRDE
ncbi:DUF5597 domain-containing protein [Asticcacaulis sp. AC402]|uniref:GH35 family beta-galactosidase n=1 Tax=Asticcacaulis sp. AC402 TaxID=1282361 RepID=UPI00042776EE|nr:DUF5597 domain-containing protein [Asticcacaulis sp. AC402]